MLESEGVSPNKSVCGSFKRNYPRLQQFLYSTPSSPTGFYSQKYGTYLPGPGKLGWVDWCGAGTPSSYNMLPEFFIAHVGVGPARSASLPFLPVSVLFFIP